MSKHTPGPWHLDVLAHTLTDTGDYDNRWIVRGNNRERIADMFEEGDQADANAQLIAAAPEMLDALKHCYDLLGRYEINRIDGDEIADEAASIIRSAITKATGEVLPW